MKINSNYQVNTGKTGVSKKAEEKDPLAQKDSVQLGSETTLTEVFMKHQEQLRTLSNNAEMGKILPEKTKLYADTYGQVKNLALQISSYASGAIRNDMLKGYAILFKEMEPDTKFTIVVESGRDKSDVQKVMKDVGMVNPDRVKFLEPDGKSLTVWARDQMLAGYFPEDPDHTLLIGQSMLHDWHGDDMDVPPLIAQNDSKIKYDPEKRIRTDGGDGVTNTKEEFRGAFSYVATAEKLQQMGRASTDLKKDVIKYFETTTGKQVVESRTGELPFKTVFRDVPMGYNMRNFQVVSNPDFEPVKVGANEMSEDQMWLNAAKKLFEEEFGKPVTIMGLDDPTTKEIEGPASDHLDMSLTPIDDKTFLLGDPELARKLLKSMSPAEKKQANERFTEIKKNALTEDIRLLKEKGDSRMSEDKKNQLIAMLEKEMDIPYNIDKELDTRAQGDKPYNFENYRKVLEEKGYEVDRVPHLEPSGWGPYITKNNSLSERFTREDGTEVRRVFLPFFGIPAIDNYAKDVWEKHDFKVIDMPLANLSSRWGALRCISQWLERGPQG